MLAAALMQTHCEKRGDTLLIEDRDIVGGILRVKRPADWSRLFMRLPLNLPHPSAGMWVEVFGALYGLWESYRLFSDEVVAVCTADGFRQSPLSPMTMVQCLPTNSDIKCIVSIHVDDFHILSNSELLVNKSSTALTARFIDITGNAPSTMFAEVSCAQHSNGALSFCQSSIGGS